MKFPRRTLVSSGLGLVLGASMMMGGTTLAAQTTGTDQAMPDRPAHIHDGTCEALGDIVEPLNDLSLLGASSGGLGVLGASDATAATTDTGMQTSTGNEMAIPVEYSSTTIPMSIDEMLSSDHALNVHESEEDMGTFIACGDIGGEIDQNGSLVVGLRELNSSGYAGIAVLSPSATADGSTDVYAFIATGLMGVAVEEAPEVAATPAPVTGTPEVEPGIIATPGGEGGEATPTEVVTEPTEEPTEAVETPTGEATETDQTPTEEATSPDNGNGNGENNGNGNGTNNGNGNGGEGESNSSD